MTDSKYFTTTKRGEIHDLQQELNHQKENVRKEAVKKVIAAMTIGKDVSVLFTDVLNCIQTTNMELKKLVYLYVINHAKLQPERAILAVNTFQKDAANDNPLIRALAIRTMGCMRVDKVTEYLCEPLRTCLKDKDPYVKKTAAICVAKLYDSSPELVESQGFIESLTALLSDSNPTVVANAVAALTEIDEMSSKNVFKITSSNLSKLQVALNECTEWGQVFILNALSKYEPTDAKDAEVVCERVTPRLNHANAAVVLAAVKVIMMFLEHIQSQETIKGLCRKMAPPLVTLLTTKEPEVQYVALRNINLIVQRRPNVLQHELRVFFIKYNDPIYVKMEKLEILIMLASERNIEQLLNEFKEAASEVDVEFVRKAVRAIGRCAIKIQKAAERCIQVLLDLIKTKVNYVVQEAIVVIKDIFRKYPNKYESIIATLCENLDTLDEPEAKASMIWIIGEYAERIDNADELLDSFLDSFHDENTQVQLQLLTATVKLFLKRPKDTQDMVQKVLDLATQETDNPDLRDRGYVYWRLLSIDPEAAKSVVLGEKPLISDTSTRLDDSLLDTLIANISSLSSVYHKPPEAFVTKLKDLKKEAPKKRETPRESSNTKQAAQGIFDNSAPKQAPTPVQPAAPVNLFDDLLGSPTTVAPTPAKEVIFSENGMEIQATMVRRSGQTFFDCTIVNNTQAPLSGFALKFNKNFFGFEPQQVPFPNVNPGQRGDVSIPLAVSPNLESPMGTPVNNIVQIALKNNLGVFYMKITVPLHAVFSDATSLNRDDYINTWKSIQEEFYQELMLPTQDISTLQSKLEAHNYIYMATRKVQAQDFLYFYATVARPNNNVAYLFLELSVGPQGSKSCVKSQTKELLPFFQQSIQTVLTK